MCLYTFTTIKKSMHSVSEHIEQTIIKGIFGDVPKDLLSTIHSNAQVRVYNPHSVIISEGLKCKGLYYVLNGAVKAYTTSENGREVILNLYTKGDSFGLKSLFQHKSFSKTVMSIEKTEVYFIPQEVINDLIKSSPSLISFMLKNIDAGIGHLHNQAIALTQKSTNERFAQVLLMLKNKFGMDYEGYLAINLRAIDYAGLVNTTRSTIYKLVKLFEDLGLIANVDGRIKILKENQLIKSAGA